MSHGGLPGGRPLVSVLLILCLGCGIKAPPRPPLPESPKSPSDQPPAKAQPPEAPPCPGCPAPAGEAAGRGDKP